MPLLRNNKKIHILLIALATITTRIIYLVSPAGQSGDADEAVFGMMAQQIAALREFPIYCWQAQYAGAPVSYFAAIIFYFFGSGFVQLHLAMLPAAFFTPILFYFIYRRMFSSVEALIGALFLVFCPFLVLRHTMAAYGGYGETYLGTALIILVSWKIQENEGISNISYWAFLLGAISGFFFYVLFLVLPAIIAFALPSIYLAKKRQNIAILPFSFGIVLGAMPMIIYNIAERGGTFVRAAGRSLSVGRDAIHTPITELIGKIVLEKLIYLKTWLASAPEMLGQYILPECFGRPILNATGLMLGIMLIWFGVLVFVKVSSPKKYYVRQFSIFLISLVLFQWIVGLNRARHMLPLLLIVPVALFNITENRGFLRKFAILALSLTCGLQVIGWHEKIQISFFDPAPVVILMKEKGVKEFYGSYWTSYPIMFVSEGAIIGSPLLLPHNEILSDRRPDYTEKVRKSLSPAFIFSDDEYKLKNKFKQFLTKHHIEHESAETQHATVFFALSEPVHAEVRSPWETSFAVKKQRIISEMRK